MLNKYIIYFCHVFGQFGQKEERSHYDTYIVDGSENKIITKAKLVIISLRVPIKYNIVFHIRGEVNSVPSIDINWPNH